MPHDVVLDKQGAFYNTNIACQTFAIAKHWEHFNKILWRGAIGAVWFGRWWVGWERSFIRTDKI